MKKFGVALLLWFAVGSAYAESYTAKVIVVIDGDTVVILREGAKLKVRLANIDAPEKAQAFGMQSRDALVGMVAKKQVQIDSQAVDQYGRIVATLSLDGMNVNEEQVRRGMAWEYSHYHSDRNYIALQSEAQQARRGLWQDASPMAPWQWRKLHPSIGPTPLVTSIPYHDKPTVLYDAACGHKKLCAQMSSCDEAYFYLVRCGVKTLDRNKDGVPCESLCR